MQTDERNAAASSILPQHAVLVTELPFHLFSTEAARILHAIYAHNLLS